MEFSLQRLLYLLFSSRPLCCTIFYFQDTKSHSFSVPQSSIAFQTICQKVSLWLINENSHHLYSIEGSKWSSCSNTYYIFSLASGHFAVLYSIFRTHGLSLSHFLRGSIKFQTIYQKASSQFINKSGHHLYNIEARRIFKKLSSLHINKNSHHL